MVTGRMTGRRRPPRPGAGAARACAARAARGSAPRGGADRPTVRTECAAGRVSGRAGGRPAVGDGGRPMDRTEPARDGVARPGGEPGCADRPERPGGTGRRAAMSTPLPRSLGSAWSCRSRRPGVAASAVVLPGPALTVPVPVLRPRPNSEPRTRLDHDDATPCGERDTRRATTTPRAPAVPHCPPVTPLTFRPRRAPAVPCWPRRAPVVPFWPRRAPVVVRCTRCAAPGSHESGTTRVTPHIGCTVRATSTTRHRGHRVHGQGDDHDGTPHAAGPTSTTTAMCLVSVNR